MIFSEGLQTLKSLLLPSEFGDVYWLSAPKDAALPFIVIDVEDSLSKMVTLDGMHLKEPEYTISFYRNVDYAADSGDVFAGLFRDAEVIMESIEAHLVEWSKSGQILRGEIGSGKNAEDVVAVQFKCRLWRATTEEYNAINLKYNVINLTRSIVGDTVVLSYAGGDYFDIKHGVLYDKFSDTHAVSEVISIPPFFEHIPFLGMFRVSYGRFKGVMDAFQITYRIASSSVEELRVIGLTSYAPEGTTYLSVSFTTTGDDLIQMPEAVP